VKNENEVKDQKTEKSQPKEKRPPAQKQQGFTLIELLVVIAIVLVLAAIAIPNFTRAKGAANTTATIGALQSYNTAQAVYSSNYGGYAATLAALGGTMGTAQTCAASQVLDANTVASLGQGTFGGYQYTPTAIGSYTVASGPCLATNTSLATGYVLAAQPAAVSIGTTSYCTDESAGIHEDPADSVPQTDVACEALPSLQP
jgi:type IV pilus assembly protein PilA